MGSWIQGKTERFLGYAVSDTDQPGVKEAHDWPTSKTQCTESVARKHSLRCSYSTATSGLVYRVSQKIVPNFEALSQSSALLKNKNVSSSEF